MNKRNYVLKKNRKLALELNLKTYNVYKCEYCGMYPLFKAINGVMKFNTLTIDHVVSLSEGGDNFLTNLKVCCFECNNRKNVYGKIFNNIIIPKYN